jgi:hypothetical protein
MYKIMKQFIIIIASFHVITLWYQHSTILIMYRLQGRRKQGRALSGAERIRNRPKSENCMPLVLASWTQFVTINLEHNKLSCRTYRTVPIVTEI